MKQTLFSLLFVLLALSSCRQKPGNTVPVVDLVAETIAGKRPAIQARVKNYNPGNAEGEIVLFGSASEVM